MTPPVPGGVAVEVAVARMEAKLDAYLKHQDANAALIQTGLTDHESRLRRLERALWTATGFAAAGGGALGAIITQAIGG